VLLWEENLLMNYSGSFGRREMLATKTAVWELNVILENLAGYIDWCRRTT